MSNLVKTWTTGQWRVRYQFLRDQGRKGPSSGGARTGQEISEVTLHTCTGLVLSLQSCLERDRSFQRAAHHR